VRSGKNIAKTGAMIVAILALLGGEGLCAADYDIRMTLEVPLYIEYSIEPYENNLPGADAPGFFVLQEPAMIHIISNGMDGQLQYVSVESGDGNLRHPDTWTVPTWYLMSPSGSPRPDPDDPNWIPAHLMDDSPFLIDISGEHETQLWCMIQANQEPQGVYTNEWRVTLEAPGHALLQHVRFNCQVALPPAPIAATLDFDPNNLHGGSHGSVVTCYVELPSGYDPVDIDVSTVLLNEAVPPLPEPTTLDDYDSDGVPDIMLKFDRSEVVAVLPIGDRVQVRVSGLLSDGTPFAGVDYIRVTPERRLTEPISPTEGDRSDSPRIKR